jgi:hypothetical protein
MTSQLASNIAILFVCSIFIVHIPLRIFAIFVTYHVIKQNYSLQEHVSIFNGLIHDWQKNPGTIRKVTIFQMTGALIFTILFFVC